MSQIALREDLTPGDLAGIPTEDLRSALADAIGVTAKTLAHLAMIWAELEARGEDLSALRGGGLFTYLPLVAKGLLLPEVVVRCAGQALVIKSLSQMSLEHQAEVMARGFALAEIGSDGSVETTRVAAERISIAQLRRAVSGDHARSIPEQVKMIAAKPPRQTTRGVIVSVRLTAEEYDQVKHAAASDGNRVPVWARKAILSAAT